MKACPAQLDGYGSMVADDQTLLAAANATTEAYAEEQVTNNVRVTREYLEPILRRTGSRSVLDVGCGVGVAITTLLADGYDAFGVDLAPLTRHWSRHDAERSRFFVVDPLTLDLPFHDDILDFAFTFGVIEHVGTLDGHATRRSDYHDYRRQWLREIFRTVRPGGHMLIGGPNRRFPLDFSHGLDSQASPLERALSRLVRVTVHRTWGEYFLWSYDDISKYLAGLSFRIEALSIHGLLKFGRVPRRVRPFAALYIEKLPRWALTSALNPWVMALVRKEPT